MQFTIFRSGRPTTFDSTLDNDTALAIVRNIANNTFAADLVRKAVVGLSVNQWAWVHHLANETTRRANATMSVPADAIAVGALCGVVAMFNTALNTGGLKRPAITFRVEEDVIRIKRAGPASRYAGSLVVVDDGTFPNNKFFGHIDAGGSFHPGRDANGRAMAQMMALAANPIGAAAAYGKVTGRCCYCDRHLQDDRSTVVGYGPVCAEKWGLPWGEGRRVARAESGHVFTVAV